MTKRASRRGARPYMTGLLCVLLAHVLTQLAWFPPERRLPTLFTVAVLVTAWYGGLLPGLMTTLLGLIGYLLVIPGPWDTIRHHNEILIGFSAVCVLLSVLSGVRLRSQMRFQGEHERLLVTLKSIGDAVLSTNSQGFVTFLNPVAERLTGWSSVEAMGRPLEEVFRIVHEKTRQTAENPVARVLREGKVVGLANHTLVIARDGTETPIDDSAAPIRGPDGNIEGVILVFRDVTDAKRVERAMRENEERFRVVADQAPVGIWMADVSGEMTWLSKKWLEYAGMGMEGALGTKWSQRIHADDSKGCLQVYGDALLQRRPFEVECRFLRHDGKYRWVLNQGSPYYDIDGKFAGYIGMTMDITERKELEESREGQLAAEKQARADAEMAGKAKDDFLAMLSHELRTPLMPVVATLRTMELSGKVPEELRGDLDTIKRNTDLEARLIDDLLDLTRISKNKLQLNLETVDVHGALLSVREICASEIEEKKQMVTLEFDARRHFVRGDTARLQQVFWNLLKNAIKFSPHNGQIVLRTSNPSDGQVRVEVVDRGIGIDSEELPKLFTAFEQGNRMITRRFGGLGLGLAISRALTEMHGGKIAAQSDGKGKGAAFVVDLPPVQPEPLIPREVDGSPKADRRKALRLLLIEDHPDTARTMGRLLEAMGHNVASATTVATGLELALGEDFDLIISDIRLPDGTGTELIRHLRLKKNTPAIALTGFGMEEDLRRSLDAGFSAHLTKPVDLKKLETLIVEWGNRA